jgi:hypothetical protein
MATTNETKWSEAPWTVAVPEAKAERQKLFVRCARRIDGAPAGIAVAHVTAAAGSAERDANAVLIAAAPDLYAALEAFMRLGTMDDQAAIDAARAALAKARGEVRS